MHRLHALLYSLPVLFLFGTGGAPFSTRVYAQAISGDLVGTVADATGAVVPNATVTALADQNSDFQLVATGRANGIVVEDYLLAQFQAANPGKIAKAHIKPLQVQYGSWAVQHGNTKLVKALNSFLCKAQKNGTLAKIYEKDFAVPSFPGLPAC